MLFEKTVPENSRQFYDYYQDMLTQNHISCENQELMLFTILELVGSTCYSCILYQQPVSMEKYLSLFTSDNPADIYNLHKTDG